MTNSDQIANQSLSELRWFANDRARLLSVFIDTDIIHGKETISIFHDDGNGNGTGIFEMTISGFLQACKEAAQLKGIE